MFVSDFKRMNKVYLFVNKHFKGFIFKVCGIQYDNRQGQLKVHKFITTHKSSSKDTFNHTSSKCTSINLRSSQFIQFTVKVHYTSIQLLVVRWVGW